MKGLVVVICAPSQGGKDFIVSKTMKSLADYDIKTSYATVYKVREPRDNDGEHIKCVGTQKDVPILQENRIEATIYGSQTIVYDKKEIQEKIESGEVVFIATGSPELAKKVKHEFGIQCINVVVKVQQVSESIMIQEDLKRYGKDKTNSTEEELELSTKRVKKRILAYEQMKPEFLDFLADDKLGANHIFKNVYTLIGGSWNETIDNMSKNEFIYLTNKVLQIYSCVNNGIDWENCSISKEERNNTNLFTLQDVWLEYLEGKIEREL